MMSSILRYMRTYVVTCGILVMYVGMLAGQLDHHTQSIKIPAMPTNMHSDSSDTHLFYKSYMPSLRMRWMTLAIASGAGIRYYVFSKTLSEYARIDLMKLEQHIIALAYRLYKRDLSVMHHAERLNTLAIRYTKRLPIEARAKILIKVFALTECIEHIQTLSHDEAGNQFSPLFVDLISYIENTCTAILDPAIEEERLKAHPWYHAIMHTITDGWQILRHIFLS